MSDVPLVKQLLQHQARFMGYLMAITRDLEAAEEVFQNVAVVVMERAAAEKPRDFYAWAKEVVRRQALSYIRDARRLRERSRPVDPSLLEGLSRSFLDDATGEEVARQEAAALRQCVEKLEDRGRRMVALRYEERRSFGEIASALETTATAVQRALSRVRRALHDCVHGALRAAEG